jgi:hypothetical protein
LLSTDRHDPLMHKVLMNGVVKQVHFLRLKTGCLAGVKFDNGRDGRVNVGMGERI